MENLTCRKCNGELKFKNNCFTCLNCGEIYSLSSGDTSYEDSGYTTKEYEDGLIYAQPERRKWMPKLIGCSTLLFLILLFIWIFMTHTTTNQVLKIFEENYLSDFKIVKVISLGSNAEGLDGENVLVLSRNTSDAATTYCLNIVSLSERTVKDVVAGYKPLNVIFVKILRGNKEINCRNLELAGSFISRYGINCFAEQDTAEEYLKLITGEDGIIDTEAARQIISDSKEYLFPDLSSSSDFYVVFEQGNANPTHYAALSSELTYNWNHIFDESTYKIWDASVDYSTKNIMKAMYGAPYVLKEVWAVVDKNFKPIGTYDSLDRVKELFEKNPQQPVQKNTTTPEKNEQEKRVLDNEFNLLFIGRDNINYADTIILFELKENKINGFSIPRDTLLDDKKLVGILKEKDGISNAKRMLEKELSVSIDYYVDVDLNVIEEIVDSVGGVTFDVPDNMVYQDPEQDLYINLKKGLRVLNGNEVCQLLRYRLYPNGDLHRVQIQQSFIKEFIEQCCEKISLDKLISIGNAIYKNVKTDYRISNLEDDLTAIYALESQNVSFSTISGHVETYKGMSVYRISK